MRGRCRVVGEDFSRLSLSPGEQKAVSVVEAESAAAAALAPVVDSRSVAGLAGYDEVYSGGQPEQDSLNTNVKVRPGGTKLLAAMLLQSQASWRLWSTLGSLYGQFLLVLMLVFCLAEVSDNSIGLLSLQAGLLLYLYVGGIAVITAMYLRLLLDSCRDSGLGFGSLKRAHRRASTTSFYLRVGALVFGLAGLGASGLEVAMHAVMEGPCLSDTLFVHPVLQALFTFLQMHFLFVDSQVLVGSLGPAARLGFLHLAATNLAPWVRHIVWDTATEWAYWLHLAASQPQSNASADLLSPQHVSQVVTLHQCLESNAYGQLWTSAMPFLYPFMVQFSLIAAAVTFTMSQSMGRNSRSERPVAKPDHSGGSGRGLCIGLPGVVAAVVVAVLFLVAGDRLPVFWLTEGVRAVVLLLAVAAVLPGLREPRGPGHRGRLDALLGAAGICGLQLYCTGGAVAGAAGMWEGSTESSLLLAVSLLQLIQGAAQSALTSAGGGGRQAAVLLLCCNAALWVLHAFVSHGGLQLSFFGPLAWGVVSRLALPLLLLYRFHSCLLLLRQLGRPPAEPPGNC